MQNLKTVLLDGLSNQFRLNLDQITDDTLLFSSGILDSLNVLDLVSFVEKSIGQPIPPTDILLENFDSVNNILNYAAGLEESDSL